MGVDDRNRPTPPPDSGPRNTDNPPRPALFVLIAGSRLLHTPATSPVTHTLCGHPIIDAIRPKNVPPDIICKRCA
jgi:hypothetical protein